MADVDFLIQILARLKDEAGPGIAKLKAEIDSLKDTQDAERGADDLADSIDNLGKKSDDTRKKSEARRKEEERGADVTRNAGRAADDTAEKVDHSAKAHDRHSESAGGAKKAQEEFGQELDKVMNKADDTSASLDDLDKKMESLIARRDELNQRKIAPDDVKALNEQREAYSDLEKQVKSTAAQYSRFATARGEGEEGIRSEAIKKAENYLVEARHLHDQADALLRLTSASRPPLAVDTAARVAQIKADEKAADAKRDLETRVSSLSIAYSDWNKAVESGSKTENETRRGYRDFASEFSSISKQFETGGQDALEWGIKADEAAKKAKNAFSVSTGGVLKSFSRGDIGEGIETLSTHFDTLGLRITGVSSFLRGFFDLAKIGLSQQLITGVISLAGGLLSVASAAAQAGAALVGVFISGLGQAIPMVAVVAASLERFKNILQAVSVAGQAEQQHFYDPTEKQVTQLQNISQLISAQQQLSNSSIQLFEAQQRVKDSQIELTEARYTAQRQITELSLAEKNARLEAEGANLSLTESKRQLAVSIQKGDAAGIQQAELAVKEAELSKKKAEYEIPKAAREARLARQRGVSEAPSVISAVEGLEGAKVAVLQAKQAGEAAERQEQITKLQEAARSSHETTYESQLKFLKKGMSPTELGLTDALIGIEKELKSPDSPLKKITDYFVEPFTDAIERIRSLLKNASFLGPIDELAKAMGAGLGKLEKATYGSGGTNFFETMAKDASANIPVVTEAIEHLMHLFEDIAKAADPAFHKLSEDWDKFWGKLDTKDSSITGLSKLEQFFSKGAQYAEDFGKLGVAVYDLFKSLGSDAAPQGAKTVEGLTGSIKEATVWVQSHGPEVRKFFSEAKEGLSLIGGIIFQIGVSLIKVFSVQSLTAFAGVINTVILPGMRNVVTILGFITTKILDIIKFFGNTGLAIVETVATVVGLAAAITKIVTVAKEVMKAWKEFKAFMLETSWTEILLNPWLALGVIITGVVALLGGFSEKQHKNKVSTEEVNQALERQVEGLRTIKALNDEYKNTKLGVEEAKTQRLASVEELAKLRNQGKPVSGESKNEYERRLIEGEQRVKRSNISVNEREREFKEAPARQREIIKKEGIESQKNLSAAEGGYRTVNEELAEFKHKKKETEKYSRETEGSHALPSVETEEYGKKIIQAEKKQEEAAKKLTESRKSNSERVVESNKVISQSMEESAKPASRYSQNYEEAYRKFEESVHKGADTAKTGMDTIKQLVNGALKNYGVSEAEISGKSTVIVKNKAGGEIEEPTYKPKYAAGEYVYATSGGRSATIAEGGHDEVVLSTDPRHAARSRVLLSQYARAAPHMAEGGVVGQTAYDGYAMRHAPKGINESSIIQTLIAAADLISARDYPYVWGGGHNSTFSGPYDCSGAVSADLHAASLIDRPEVSGELASWGEAGRGKLFTVFANPIHTYMEIMGRQFGTHGNSGAGWYTGSPLPAPPERAITAATKAMNLPENSSLSGINSILERITAPTVKGGAAIGSVVQRALDLTTKAANTYLEKRVTGSAASLSGASLGSPTAGKLGPSNKREFAQYLANYTGLPVNFLGAWINHEQGSSTVEGGNNWLNVETGGPGGGSGPYGATAKWVERHTPKQAAAIEAEWLRHNLPELLRAKSAVEAVDILENSGYAESHYDHQSPQEFLSEYATGGLIGDQVRRVAIRHLRKKVLKFAQGGRAPWGGAPIPIIAHEGERVLNPAQFSETARLAGTSPRGLDHHLGYDGSPRQHFADGGPVIIGQHSQPSSAGASASLGLPAPGSTSLTLNKSELSNINSLIKLIKAISEGFEKIGKAKTPEKYKEEIQGFFKSVSEAFEFMNEGREALKARLSKQAVGREYTETGKFASSGKGFKSSGNQGTVALGAGGETKIAEESFKALREENILLQKEQQSVENEKKTISSNIKHSKSKTAIAMFKQEYNTLVERQKLLGEAAVTNIEARYQIEVQTLQDRITEANSAYQTISGELTSQASIASSKGNYQESANLQKSIASAANNQIKTLEPILQNAKNIGSTEQVKSIEQELTSLKQSVADSVIEYLSNLQSNITQKFAGTEASEQSKLSVSQAYGKLSISNEIEESIKSTAEAKYHELGSVLNEAESSGDTTLATTIKQEMASLETTIFDSVANRISNAQSLIQRESGQAESRTSMLEGLSKVAAQEGKFSEAGNLEREGLLNKGSNLLSVKSKDEALLNEAKSVGDETAIVSLTEELNKNTQEIAENNLALKENAVVTRELVLNQIQATGQFKTGVYGAAQSGLEILGKTTGYVNVGGMLSAAKGKEGALGTERSELEGQAGTMGLGVEGMTPAQILSYLASPEGQSKLSALEKNEDKAEKEQMYKLVDALETNATNTLKNAEEIAKLNGQLNQPQSWSTQAWQQMRGAFFGGMGNLLPQYSSTLPPGSVPTEMPKYGEMAPGPSRGPTIGTLNLAHPVEKLDPQLLGEELSHHIGSMPGMQ